MTHDVRRITIEPSGPNTFRAAWLHHARDGFRTEFAAARWLLDRAAAEVLAERDALDEVQQRLEALTERYHHQAHN